jgi:hypothetical protein
MSRQTNLLSTSLIIFKRKKEIRHPSGCKSLFIRDLVGYNDFILVARQRMYTFLTIESVEISTFSDLFTRRKFILEICVGFHVEHFNFQDKSRKKYLALSIISWALV